MKHKELFANNPSKDEVFQTSDGYFFWEQARAQSHAVTLENRKVKQFIREAENETPTEEATIEAVQEAEAISETENVETVQETVVEEQPTKPSKAKK